jgi:PIN domain
LFADADIADGLFGDRYWHIAGLKPGSAYGTRIINQEIGHQDARLSQAIQTLRQWQKLGERPGDLLALDTNTFLQCRLYNEIPWADLAHAESVRLILTMPVLDEIEAKKQGENDRLRKRARKVLPRIDKAFGDDGHEFFHVEKDGKPMPGVTLEILRDPPDYRRVSSDIDAEFLDRCEFLQLAAGRPVTVVTADTGMKIRARRRLGGFTLLTVPSRYRLLETDPSDS